MDGTWRLVCRQSYETMAMLLFGAIDRVDNGVGNGRASYGFPDPLYVYLLRLMFRFSRAFPLFLPWNAAVTLPGVLLYSTACWSTYCALWDRWAS